ncbi:MAG: hypothetical protein CSB48_11675 [Proteobacteria bacterium]|nr:MAG: hypothetical protein CSB48_11675 [Pseudomonadota bacterium]PIE40132.1 MAG: hypothetical protein CSA51_02530 [Gammaproteobacteria bacterium]
MSQVRVICSVYKSTKKEGMYLYVDKKNKLDGLPEALLQLFGQPVQVVDFLLTPEKKLAEVEAGKVLGEIREKGYFLQMPPQEENLLKAHRAANGLDPDMEKNSGG